jgi:chemotaxis protein MotB
LARRKKTSAEHVNHERWLVSYSDFVTLLFAFFVVMFASSQTDKYKAKAVSDSVREALEKGGVVAAVREVLGGTVDDLGKGNALLKGPGGSQPKNIPLDPPPPNQTPLEELAPSMKYLSTALQDEIKDGKIVVKMEARGLVVSLKQNTFFPSGTDAIDPATYSIVDKIGATIMGTRNPVRLEGHTDSDPIHTDRFPSNWELSTARSISMLKMLAARCHVPEGRMAVAGYADTMPEESNETLEGRRHNRRVDIVLLSQVTAKGTAAAEPTKATDAAKSPNTSKSAAPTAAPPPVPSKPPAPGKK